MTRNGRGVVAACSVALIAGAGLATPASASPQAVRAAALVHTATQGKVTGKTPDEVEVASPGDQTSEVGQAIELANAASGGTPPYTWSEYGLPAGLSIGSSTGTVSGTLTEQGISHVSLTAKDTASRLDSAHFTWTVCQDGGAPVVDNPAFHVVYIGQAASVQMNAACGSGGYTWKASGLPPGLSLNTTTGLISGTPTQSGHYPSQVTATDTSSTSTTVTVDWFAFH